MLPSVICEIQTYAELGQCWTIWSSAEANPKLTDKYEKLWMAALDRMFEADCNEISGRLQLAIEVYDFFQSETALDRVRAAREIFTTSEFSITRYGNLVRMLL